MSSILVTGATRGLGFELVKQLISLPQSVIETVFITGRSPEAPEAVRSVVDNSKGRAFYIVLDVGNDDSVTQSVSAVQAYLNGRGLDILINNAGTMIHDGTAVGMKIESMDKIFSSNVISIQRVMTAFLPLIEKGQQKKIVNVTSTLGSIGLIKNFALSDTPSYKISKAALNMLTSLWAMELGPKGYTVFVISPGWLKTDLGGGYADLEVSQGASQVIEIVLGATPSKDNGAFRDIYVEGHPTYPGTNPPW